MKPAPTADRRPSRTVLRPPAAAAAVEPLEDRRLFSVTVNGTAGNDVISIYQTGVSFDVTVNGVRTNTGNRPVTNIIVNCLAGNDQVFLSAGITLPTYLYGGAGNDTIKGGRGPDTIDGGSGTDTLRGSDGNDTIKGMAGDDVIYAGLGDDAVHGGRGNDYIDGEQGNDYLLGNGTPADGRKHVDNDVIHGGEGNDLVEGVGGNDAVYGDQGIDEVNGGSGNDRVYGGADNDRLIGGSGDDVMVAVGGGKSDSVWGGSGRDSFWLDDERTTELVLDGDAAESAASAFHFVGQFENNVTRIPGGPTYQERPTKELYGQNLRDPTSPTATASFRGRPLFGPSGPLMEDVRQGDVGDCYFLAGLSAMAKVNPTRMREAVVDLGDGTFAVRFARSGVAKYYRVDGDLPAANGVPVYAKLGHANALWVAIVEKAFAYHRYYDGGNYANLELGLSNEPFNAFAVPNNDDAWGTSGPDTLAKIKQQLDLGRAVVASSVNDSPLHGIAFIEKHQYVVVGVDLANGRITVRNPWGYDGAGNDGNPADGLVTFTATQFFQYFREATTAMV